MLENELKILNYIIEEKKMTKVSENELSTLAREYDASKRLVIEILKTKYNGRYVEPWDAHFCGEYAFDNPHHIKEEYYVLNRIEDFKTSPKLQTGVRVTKVANKNFEIFADAMSRYGFDRIEYQKALTDIQTTGICVGERTLYFVSTGKW